MIRAKAWVRIRGTTEYAAAAKDLSDGRVRGVAMCGWTEIEDGEYSR